MNASTVRSRYLANATGQLVATAAPLATVPVLLTTVGLAGYGLVGMMTALTAALSAFTRGLSWALQRDVAQGWNSDEGQGLRTLTRTYELVVTGLTLLVALLVVLLSEPLARLIPSNASVGSGTVQVCVGLLGLKLLGALPFGAYQAVLLGSGRHLLANVLLAAGILATAVGTVVTAIMTRSVVAVVLADAVGWLVICLAAKLAVQRVLPAQHGPWLLPRQEVVRRIPLNLGLLWTHGAGLLISQVDRLTVGSQLSLDALGSYTPAAVAGRSLRVFYSPYLTSTFPGLCRSAAGEDAGPALLVHVRRSTAVTGLLAGTVGAVLGLFAFDVLAVWTQRDDLAAWAASTLALAVAAGVALGQADTLYQVHIALGRSKVPAVLNALALGWLPIAALLLVPALGIDGAALSFLLYALVHWSALLVSLQRLVPGAAAVHLRQAISCLALPLAAGLVARVAVDMAEAQGLLSDNWSRLLLGATVTTGLVGLVVQFVRRRRRQGNAGAKIEHVTSAPEDAPR